VGDLGFRSTMPAFPVMFPLSKAFLRVQAGTLFAKR